MAIQNISSVTRVQSTAASNRTYTVKPGDYLAKIAREQLGDVNRWPEIYAMNKSVIGSNPNLIYAGQVYRLPARQQTPTPDPKPNPTPTPKPNPSPIPIEDALNPEVIRIGTPLIAKVGGWLADKFNLGGGFTGGASGGFMNPHRPATITSPVDPSLGGGFGVDPGISLPSEPMIGDPSIGIGGEIPADFAGGTMSTGLNGGLSGISNGISRVFDSLKNAVSVGFQAAKGALKRNFIFAGITSAVSNGIAYFTGKATGKQAVSGFVADTGAYTAIGSASTFAGAALGTLIPIPFVGTVVGIAAGMGLGYLYEKFVRKNLISNVSGFVDQATGSTGKNALDRLSL